MVGGVVGGGDGSAEQGRTWRNGLRDGAPYGAAAFVLAVSFGVVATDAGMPAVAAIVMSALVYSGSGQFAALGVAGSGGGVGAAVGTATLVSSRFLPMGFALGPSLRGSRLRRALEGQATVDASWAMAARGEGRYDREYLFGHSAAQYVPWVAGTAAAWPKRCATSTRQCQSWREYGCPLTSTT